MAKAVVEYAPTTTGTPTTSPQVQLLDTQADGYCDPVNGVCMLPGATTGEPTDQLADETTVMDASHTQATPTGE